MKSLLRKKQQGLTFISIAALLGLLAFFVLLFLKVGPIYLNHSKVVDALYDVEKMGGLETLSKREIYTSFSKRFDMNYVTNVSKDDITITKHDGYLKVEIEYERVEKLFFNLSALVEFYDFFEVGESDEE